MLNLSEELFLPALNDAKGKLVRRVADRLVEEGVLQREHKRFLWIIPYATYPQQDVSGRPATAKHEVKRRLRAGILGGETSDARTLALLCCLVQNRTTIRSE